MDSLYKLFPRFSRQKPAPEKRVWRSINRPLSDIDCVNAAVSSVSKALLILSEIKKTHKRCEDEEALGLENLQKALKVLKDELDDINGNVLEKHRGM